VCITYRKQKVKENHINMIEYLLVHPCSDCGTTDLLVLEFDHIDGKNKTTEISKMVKNACSWATILTEIAKCVVRCANCHRRKTHVTQRSFRAKYLKLVGRE
jgi:hypothetical protein